MVPLGPGGRGIAPPPSSCGVPPFQYVPAPPSLPVAMERPGPSSPCPPPPPPGARGAPPPPPPLPRCTPHPPPLPLPGAPPHPHPPRCTPAAPPPPPPPPPGCTPAAPARPDRSHKMPTQVPVLRLCRTTLPDCVPRAKYLLLLVQRLNVTAILNFEPRSCLGGTCAGRP